MVLLSLNEENQVFRSNDYSTGRIVPLHQSRSAILLLTANDVVTAIGLFVTEVGQGMSDQALPTLRASLSGTFLQTLPGLVTPLKGHSLSPNSARFSYATEGALFTSKLCQV